MEFVKENAKIGTVVQKFAEVNQQKSVILTIGFIIKQSDDYFLN